MKKFLSQNYGRIFFYFFPQQCKLFLQENALSFFEIIFERFFFFGVVSGGRVVGNICISGNQTTIATILQHDWCF